MKFEESSYYDNENQFNYNETFVKRNGAFNNGIKVSNVGQMNDKMNEREQIK
jgi:hypothetical protein